jgi:hypothetical protein
LPIQPVLAHGAAPGEKEHESQPKVDPGTRQGNWELAESELDRLTDLYHRGLISHTDLIIGRYRTLRQAQHNAHDQS